MLIAFDTTKTIQAAAVLLKQHAGRMSRLRLLKLLYIADRETLQETGRPITGDRVAAMKNGPVLSRTYDLIKGEDFAAPAWEEFIQREGPQDVRLRKEPGVGKLSRQEIAKLTAVSDRYSASDDWDIAEITHDFPEWKKNKPEGNSRAWIPLDDLLEAMGLLADKDRLLSEMQADADLDRLLAMSKRAVQKQGTVAAG